MNCHDVAAALDERRADTLAAEVLRAVETHAEGCDECRRALEAERALRADRVPQTPALDLVRLVAAHAGRADAGGGRRRRSTLRPAIIGVLAVGGAAFAALGVFSTGSRDGGGAVHEAPATAARPDAGGVRPEAALTAARRSLIEYVDEAETAAANALREELMRLPTPPDGDMFALLKVPPSYPPRAAAQALEGYAIVEFTVTRAGDVADPVIVESSDPIFEAPTLEAIRRAKYKPRVVNGRAVAVQGIRNRFTYVVEAPREEAGREGAPEARQTEGDLSFSEFRALLGPALDCVERSDLLCVELSLDEIRAIHSLTARQESELARIYGFVYHRLGDYERAIAAYERAARPFDEPPFEGSDNWFAGPWMTAAMIHYERHRYQEALDAAIRYLRAVENPRPADYVFVDRLRQLGAIVR